MEPRRIAVVMLLPLVNLLTAEPKYCIQLFLSTLEILAAIATPFFTSFTLCWKVFLSRTRQHQRDVVGLLVVADPVIHRHGDDLADLRQRQMAVVAHQIDEPMFAELAKIIF